jgi:hypothetical protein
MVNRPAGGARSERYEREPYDWYCEDTRPVDQLMGAIDFEDDLIYDPSCGRGNILDVAKRRGHQTIGSDIIRRTCPVQGSPVDARHKFVRGNFLLLSRAPVVAGLGFSIINNPPYSYQPDICEKFIRKALTLPLRRAAFLVPIAFLNSNDRWAFFQRDFRPSHVAILSERPSMPPGSKITPYTEFKGGMQDYVWIIYTAGNGHRWRTETIWLRPSCI